MDAGAVPVVDPGEAADELRRYGETVEYRMDRSRRIAVLTVFPAITIMFAAFVWFGLAGGPGWLVVVGLPAFLLTAGGLKEELVPALRDEPVVVVGPDGIRLRRLGLIPWSGVSRVELESVRGFGGHDEDEPPKGRPYARIGIWPRDEALGRRFTNWLGRYVLESRDLAPTGVYGYQLEAPVDEVVERIGLYVDVGRGAPP